MVSGELEVRDVHARRPILVDAEQVQRQVQRRYRWWSETLLAKFGQMVGLMGSC